MGAFHLAHQTRAAFFSCSLICLRIGWMQRNECHCWSTGNERENRNSRHKHERTWSTACVHYYFPPPSRIRGTHISHMNFQRKEIPSHAHAVNRDEIAWIAFFVQQIRWEANQKKKLRTNGRRKKFFPNLWRTKAVRSMSAFRTPKRRWSGKMHKKMLFLYVHWIIFLSFFFIPFAARKFVVMITVTIATELRWPVHGALNTMEMLSSSTRRTARHGPGNEKIPLLYSTEQS